MNLFSWVGDYALPFLLVITVLVFVHELGHYLVARRNGVRVEVFSIGFGPELWGWTDAAGTRWKFSAVPLGGYIRMFGDEDATSRPGENIETMSPEDRKVSFFHKRVGQRMAIVFAGPAANYLFAILMFAGLFTFIGQPFFPPIIGEVVEDSAAAQAGLQAEDRIIEINGMKVDRFEDIQAVVRKNAGVELEVVALRENQERAFLVTPQAQEETDNLGNTHHVGLLGVSRTGREYIRHSPASAVGEAVKQTYEISITSLQAFYQIITGNRSTEELGGPLRIAQISGEVSQYGLTNILWFIALLSVNLGLINLFPIPLLDGGHLLYFGAEAIRGKPLGEKAQEYGFRLGITFIVGLMLFATWNDLVQMGFFQFVSGIVN